ncbi:hypothetical protein OAM69_06705 [bacterium]|nr:hypothetical protein [bacterium]
MKSTHRPDRILDNPKTESAFDGQFLPPQSLSDRMIQSPTSAVSIAVIDDFQLAEAGAFTAGSTQPTYPIADSFSCGVRDKIQFGCGELKIGI